jgi:hypothetical protein
VNFQSDTYKYIVNFQAILMMYQLGMSVSGLATISPTWEYHHLWATT